VLPQIEALKHHGEPGADTAKLRRIGWLKTATAIGLHLNFFALNADGSAARQFQHVDAAEHCRLAGSRSADDGNHITIAGGKRYTLENFQVTKSLVKTGDFDGWRDCCFAGFSTAHTLPLLLLMERQEPIVTLAQ
jgi:hypothetical protein